jgi:2-dehydro-3-deoxyphosphogluconate aldolase/(4S)-4-hydroxy-2-oxoglutarate aldolase
MTLTTDGLLSLAPVIPVIVLEDADDAVPLARALVAGGLPAIEVTLRTAAAMEAIERIAAEVPDAVVGAGTVVGAAQCDATPSLLDALQASGVPFLAGTATASDIVALLERGVTAAKLFPADVLGGVDLLRAFAGPFGQMRFCPTGGIDAERAPAYLALPNVACVGGSWMAPRAALRAGDWDAVEGAARAAAALRPVAGDPQVT